MSAFVKSALDALLSFFYPEVCQVCLRARATPDEGYLCRGCTAQAQRMGSPWCDVCGQTFAGSITGEFICGDCRETPPAYDYARSVMVFEGPVREAIHQWKYQQAFWLERRLAEWLTAAAGPALRAGDWHALVPVPLHPVKERERGFNQAARLAGPLSQATGLPLNTQVLKRVKHTVSQTRLSRAERAANLRGAFVAARGERLAGARLVLVDDVMTTGATLNAAATALRQAGAEAVCAWTLARGR
ncbi:ComF family protein [Fontisphaera persica]|uniref:ComF family protein n=1 Tax=Fontisphaera persica TaxID=2974023 RepID=UPI0024C04358|nr:ComF family protein [Fontisphaera persica]WCJ59117.1 ComF family protein [Fontisphaera persica]